MLRPGLRLAVRNFGWLAFEKAVRFALNVVVGFWVARYLQPTGFGVLNYAIALSAMLALLGELGLDALVRRELIAHPGKAPDLLATAATLRLGGGMCGYALLVCACALGFGGAMPHVALILGVTIFQPVLGIADPWFQARLEARIVVLVQLSVLVGVAAGRIIAICYHAPLAAFAWLAAAESIVAAIVLSALAARHGLRIGRIRAGIARSLARSAWPLLLSGAAVLLYTRIDTVMLRQISGDAPVGVYSAAVRLTEVWYFVPVALASSVLPALLRAKSAGAAPYRERMQQYYDISVAIAYGIALPLCLWAQPLVRLAYGSAYIASGAIVALHIWSCVLVFLGVARTQYLINEGFTGFYLAATSAGLVANVAFNLVLIPRYGAIGAVEATLLGQAIATFLSSFCFAPARESGWLQLRALFIPLRAFRYGRRL
jgi:PST family polysaccharide transporter